MRRPTLVGGGLIAGLMIIVTAIQTIVAQEKAVAPQDTDSSLGEYVTFGEVGVKLRQPKGFQKEKSFVGFGNEASKASILITKLPAPVAEVSKGFTKENIESRGWEFYAREEVKLDGDPAVLIHFEQTLGVTAFEKWALVLGDEKKTLLVTATFPSASKKELEPTLKAAVLSTRQTAVTATDPRDSMPFTIKSPTKLKPTESPNGLLMYSLDGKIPAKSPEDAVLVLAPSLGKVGPIDDRKDFAERRLYDFPGIDDIEIDSIKEVTIDGIKGYEVLAKAVDDESKSPLKLYEVMLFDEGSYILVFGRVGEKQSKEHITEFKGVAESIKRRTKVK